MRIWFAFETTNLIIAFAKSMGHFYPQVPVVYCYHIWTELITSVFISLWINLNILLCMSPIEYECICLSTILLILTTLSDSDAYEPLVDFLGLVKEQRPKVFVLIGPFVDAKNELVSNTNSQVNDFTIIRPYQCRPNESLWSGSYRREGS